MLQGAQARQPGRRQMCTLSNGAAHLLKKAGCTIQDAWLALASNGCYASHVSSALQYAVTLFAWMLPPMQ